MKSIGTTRLSMLKTSCYFRRSRHCLPAGESIGKSESIAYSVFVKKKLQIVIDRIDNTSVSFTISGSSIEMVDSWTHLGHVISRDSDDRLSGIIKYY